MDLVPLDFSERVAAAWKCCESVRCRCLTPVFSGRNWTFPKATNATFVLFPDARGEWKFYFHLQSGIDLTMSELLKHPDFKNIRIDSIDIDGMYPADRMKPVSDVGMEKLLSFVSFLANEPRLFIEDASEFKSPEGALLLTWLEQRWFSEIEFWTSFDHSAFKRMLQKQFSRRIPPSICVGEVIGDTEIFAEQLRSGQMTRFEADSFVFSSDVMEGIVQSFLRSPSEKKVDIYAKFDDSTEGRLMEMKERGLCRRVDGKFIFENPFHRLQVSPPDVSTVFYTSEWTCVTA